MEKERERELFEVVCCKPHCCKHPFICESLFGRGDRSGIGLDPSLVEVIVLVVSLFGRGGVWL